jgi:hypothetical protein
MGAVEKPVEDGIGDGGLAQCLMPESDRDLAGDDRRAKLGAIFDDLKRSPDGWKVDFTCFCSQFL